VCLAGDVHTLKRIPPDHGVWQDLSLPTAAGH
jgi:hypothetical protein